MSDVVNQRDAIHFEDGINLEATGDATVRFRELVSNPKKHSALTRSQEIELINNLQGLYRECLEEIRQAPNCLEILPLFGEILKENRMFSFGLLMENTEVSSTQLGHKFFRLISEGERSNREIQEIIKDQSSEERLGWSAECATQSSKAFDRFKFTTAAVDYLAPLYIKTFSSQFSGNSKLDTEIQSFVTKVKDLFDKIVILRDVLFDSQEEILRSIVKSKANKFSHSNDGLKHDLMQGARISLYVAMHRFDTSRGIRFSTYATGWINAAIFDEIYDNLTTVRVPRYVLQALNREDKFGGAIRNSDGTYSNEVSAELRSAMDSARRVMSLSYFTQDSSQLQEHSVSVDHCLARLEEVDFPSDKLKISQNRQQSLELIKRKVTEREFAILTMRLGMNGAEPKTLQEVANFFSISAERVRQIFNIALEKARDVVKFRPQDLDI